MRGFPPRARFLVGTAVAAVLAAGCGTDVPAGFTAAAAESGASRVSLTYPEKWSKVPAGQRAPHATFAARRATGSGTVAKVAVLTGLGQAGDAGLAVAMAMAGPQVGWRDYDKEREEAIEVPGAHDAARVDYTYSAVRPGGSGAATHPAAGTDVVLVGDDRRVTVVRVTWRRGGKGAVTEGTVSSIVASVRVKND